MKTTQYFFFSRTIKLLFVLFVVPFLYGQGSGKVAKENYDYGIQYLINKDYENAKNYLEKSYNEVEHTLTAYILGCVYSSLNDYKSAKKYCEYAIQNKQPIKQEYINTAYEIIKWANRKSEIIHINSNIRRAPPPEPQDGVYSYLPPKPKEPEKPIYNIPYQHPNFPSPDENTYNPPVVINGLSVQSIGYKTYGNFMGEIKMIQPKKWLETDQNGINRYWTETIRNEWQVYLQNDKDGVTILLDLQNKSVVVLGPQHQTMAQIVSIE